MQTQQSAIKNPSSNENLSFEKVWTMFQETDKKIQELRESQKETDWQIKETERIIKERQIETDRQIKETDRILTKKSSELNIKIGSLTNLFGDFTVGMVAPMLREKFTEFGLVFPRANLNVVIDDKINKIALEIDIMLENGEKAMLVEVKTKLTTNRIEEHIERLGKMRKYADLHGDKRIFLGAVAGFAVTEEVRKIALKSGFYLIEPDGKNFNITSPEKSPREW